VSILGVFFTAMVIGVGAFVMPALACPPDEDEVKSKASQNKAHAAPVAKVRTLKPGQTAPTPPPTVQFFGEAPALEAMKDGQAAPVAPQPPTPPTAPTPRTPKPAKAPQPPAAFYSVPAQPAMPAPPALTPQPGPATDLEALKIGRTPLEYHLSAGKLEAFYGMMSRGDVPILVQLNDDHIVIWGTDD